MATTTQHINARNDSDLMSRFIAAAEMMHVTNASTWVMSHMAELVTQEVDGAQTVTDVYAYAREVRENYIADTPVEPGLNLGAVTDANLDTALLALSPPISE